MLLSTTAVALLSSQAHRSATMPTPNLQRVFRTSASATSLTKRHTASYLQQRDWDKKRKQQRKSRGGWRVNRGPSAAGGVNQTPAFTSSTTIFRHTTTRSTNSSATMNAPQKLPLPVPRTSPSCTFGAHVPLTNLSRSSLSRPFTLNKQKNSGATLQKAARLRVLALTRWRQERKLG